ncbi:TLDc domain-containing protein [Entamoeba marina]
MLKRFLEWCGINNKLAAIHFIETHHINEDIQKEIMKGFGITTELLRNSKQIVENLRTNDDIGGRLESLPIDEGILKKEAIFAQQRGILSRDKDECVQKTCKITKLHMQLEEMNSRIEQLRLEQLNSYPTYQTEISTFEQPQPQQIHSIKVIESNWISLQKWSGMSQYDIVFDSEVDQDNTNAMFNSKVMNKSNLYFVTFDEFGNVFGSFIKDPISQIGSYNFDVNNFIFSLIQIGKNEIKTPLRWFLKDKKKGGAYLWKDSDCLFTIGSYEGFFRISKIHLKDSYCHNISATYQNISNYDLNNTNKSSQRFAVERIVVLQMK